MFLTKFMIFDDLIFALKGAVAILTTRAAPITPACCCSGHLLLPLLFRMKAEMRNQVSWILSVGE